MEDPNPDYDRKKMSKWFLTTLYVIIVITLIVMIVSNRTPIDSPVVETIVNPNCLSAESPDCNAPAYQLNGPFVIYSFIVMSGMLVLFLRPWQIAYASSSNNPN